jgi:serine phosphatase RsbU (regulator of sigma subunit)
MTIDFPATAELYLFTDGIYELTDAQGGHGSHEEFVHYLDERVRAGESAWQSMLDWLNAARKHSRIDDDVTLLRFATSP